MALKKCRECGKKVSTKAKNCPNCGAPVKTSNSVGCLTIIVAITALVLIGSLFDKDKPDNPPPTPSRVSVDPDKVKQGEKLLLKILAQYPRLDLVYFRRPHLYGELSNHPRLIVSVPESSWRTLSLKERLALRDYVKSFISDVRIHPFRYSRIPPTAPIAPKIRNNVAKITGRDWGIVVGKLSVNGDDISLDRIVSDLQ